MDKRSALRDAIGLVSDGHRVALGGMTLYRRPVAAALTLAAVKRRDLEIISFTAGIETDLLIGAGCIKSLRSCYAGLEIVGFAPHYTRALQQGTLTAFEETEYTMSYAVQAAAMHVPFLPMRGDLVRTDIFSVRPDLKLFDCPITGEKLIAVPALDFDVAIIHATAADRFGNCSLQGQLALDRILPSVAKITIITAEKIVETETLMKMQGGIQIPGIFVTCVVDAPGGSLPTSCYPAQPLDLPKVLDYAEAAAEPEAWARWLSQAIKGLV
jgi:glutaconate CoA-transferase subunit A